MNKKMALLICLIGFSVNSFTKDEIIASLPQDNNSVKPQNTSSCDDIFIDDVEENTNKALLKKLGFPKKTKKIYLEDKIDAPEYPIIERLLYCFSLKYDYLGKYACEQVASNAKELHYIMRGTVVEDLAELSQDMVVQDLILFYEIFKNDMDRSFNDYEINNLQQVAVNQYTLEFANEELWNKIKELRDSNAKAKEEKRDFVKVALTIERSDAIESDEWQKLVQVVCQCVKECEEAGENCPTFLQDAKEHIRKIILEIEKLPSFSGLFHLEADSDDAKE